MQIHKITHILILLSLLSFTFVSCKKDDDDHQHTIEQNLTLHIHNTAGTSEISYNTEYTNLAGRKLTFTDFRYYISNIVLIKSDGTELPISGKVFLVSPLTKNYSLGKVPVGSYKGFRFIFGLDSLTNHADPGTYPADHPLAYQSNSIHWSWNSGYIFMKMEGKVDTTLAANGIPDKEYYYHIGTDMLRRTIDFSNKPFSVTSGSDKEILITCNALKILENVDMRTENASHTMGTMPLATKIANNWLNAFSVE